MCTSVTFKTADGNELFARTMDFPFVLDSDVIMMPRGFAWVSTVDEQQFKNKYAFIGMGNNTNNELIFADGVNETGLSCASLYFAGYAEYETKVQVDKMNIAPHELVAVLLASCSTISEVKEMMEELNIIAKKVNLLGVVTPLHWVVTDQTGASIIIEPVADGIKIYDNIIGVMTNSPDYNWHLTNLRNYIGVSPKQQNELIINGIEFKAFGQGGGSFALPGGFTPPARFVRTVFSKVAAAKAENLVEGVETIFHVLAGVNITKGNVMTIANESDYTQYTACMSNTTKEYYFNTYENSQISVVSLMKEDLESKDLKIWKVQREQQINYLNK